MSVLTDSSQTFDFPTYLTVTELGTLVTDLTAQFGAGAKLVISAGSATILPADEETPPQSSEPPATDPPPAEM